MQILKNKTMKILKTLLFALVATFFFGSAEAQVRVKASVGDKAAHRRMVVVHHPVRHYHHRHVVVRHY
jgi:hypothetical protein